MKDEGIHMGKADSHEKALSPYSTPELDVD